MSANGHSRTLKAGVWAPIPTFFDANEELDVETFKKHVVSLAKVGMQPVVCGSMGEAFALVDEERKTLFVAAREALDQAGLHDTVIIAGTGANSTRGTIRLCKIAAEAGADVAIVIAPGYYAGAMSREALKTFFLEVQAASPLPVMIYNFPGAAGGLDLDSDIISEIATEGDNICGTKLTCGAVGKLTRISAVTGIESFGEKHPRKSKVAPKFVTLGGFADFLLPSIVGGRSDGAIMGLGNIYPRSIAKLFELSQKIASSEGSAEDLQKALHLQGLVSAADGAFTKVGIAGTKWFLKTNSGYSSARLRHPLLEMKDERGKAFSQEDAVTQLLAFEKELAK